MGHEGVLALLLEHGASVTLADNGGYTALLWASEAGHKGVVSALPPRPPHAAAAWPSPNRRRVSGFDGICRVGRRVGRRK